MKRLYIATPINSLKGDDLAEKKRKAKRRIKILKTVLADEEAFKGYELFSTFDLPHDAAREYPWVRCFALYVKDTVEGELADAAIRILDLAGVLKWDIGETVEVNLCRDDEATQDHTPLRYYFRTCSFTEAIYEICEDIVLVGIDSALTSLFLLADVMDFDLMEHIRLKMQYNRTRERLHGKKY